MIFEPAPLEGVFVVRPEVVEDERGSFMRTFCEAEFRMVGLDPHVAQCSISSNTTAGTLRGLHLQTAAHGETKLVRCTQGEIFDVVADLRSGSATFGAHFAVALSSENRLALVVPPGVAHGFVTLVADTDVAYQMSTSYVASSATGVRWDDPALAINWPALPRIIVSERDASLPTLQHWT